MANMKEKFYWKPFLGIYIKISLDALYIFWLKQNVLFLGKKFPFAIMIYLTVKF